METANVPMAQESMHVKITDEAMLITFFDTPMVLLILIHSTRPNSQPQLLYRSNGTVM
jgi:hypothetical protein